MRATLAAEKQVAIPLWKLGMPDCYLSAENQFGVGKSTAGMVVMEMCRAINRLLLCRTVTLSNVQGIVDGFSAIGVPN